MRAKSVHFRNEDSPAFCKGCGYSLRFLDCETRDCPECGRAFDPANRRTYSHHRWRAWIGRWARRAALVMLATLLIAGIGLGWLWLGWHSEQKVIGEIHQLGADRASVQTVRIGPPFLGRVLGRLDYLCDRVDEIYLSQDLDPRHDSTVIDPIDFKSLTYLRSVGLGNMHVRESTVAKLAELSGIRNLSLYNIESDPAAMSHLKRFTALTQISFAFTLPTDEDWLANLSALPHLKWIDLQVTGIGDKGLEHLKTISTLEYLDLRYCHFSKEGIRQLNLLTSLHELHLGGTMLDDAAFLQLREIKSLREVYTDPKTKVSPAAIQQLRRALPQVSVKFDRAPD